MEAEVPSGLDSLRTAATELKSAAAASETPADRISLHWLQWQNQGSVEKEGDVRRARLASKVKGRATNVRGPRRQGPHADTQADSDLQVLRRAATSFDSLRTAATELKAEAAASDSIEDRNERSWKNYEQLTKVAFRNLLLLAFSRATAAVHNFYGTSR